ncbi:hypothetical protein FUAX_03590 [Fulvitalea axinellae]|uniref:Uncharacterized protein n=1 Tax=Fulvitalea axinellae TaxID=1182444 RepID=A0AAU9CRC6_9BACT|nr:hypothetical protein FUAX_03590 [Fulvitalea axinellae]
MGRKFTFRAGLRLVLMGICLAAGTSLYGIWSLEESGHANEIRQVLRMDEAREVIDETKTEHNTDNPYAWMKWTGFGVIALGVGQFFWFTRKLE